MTSEIDQLAKLWTDYVDDNWAQLPLGDLEDLRHVLLHLVKLTGKLASPLERAEDGHGLGNLVQIKMEVIPDLLVWAFHLAHSLDVNLVEAYQERLLAIK